MGFPKVLEQFQRYFMGLWGLRGVPEYYWGLMRVFGTFQEISRAFHGVSRAFRGVTGAFHELRGVQGAPAFLGFQRRSMRFH